MNVNDVTAWVEQADKDGLQHVTAPVSGEALIFNAEHRDQGFVWVKRDELLGCDAAGEPVKLISPEESRQLMNRLRKLNK
jgi:hypothetical protein